MSSHYMGHLHSKATTPPPPPPPRAESPESVYEGLLDLAPDVIALDRYANSGTPPPGQRPRSPEPETPQEKKKPEKPKGSIFRRTGEFLRPWNDGLDERRKEIWAYFRSPAFAESARKTKAFYDRFRPPPEERDRSRFVTYDEYLRKRGTYEPYRQPICNSRRDELRRIAEYAARKRTERQMPASEGRIKYQLRKYNDAVARANGRSYDGDIMCPLLPLSSELYIYEGDGEAEGCELEGFPAHIGGLHFLNDVELNGLLGHLQIDISRTVDRKTKMDAIISRWIRL